MNETPPPSDDAQAQYGQAFRKMRRRQALRKAAKRSGCLVVFIVWLMLMATPCFFITLLVQKEIVISRSNLPEHEYRLFLLEENDTRGFGFSTGRIESGGAEAGEFCVVTSIRYLLWEGENENVIYCDCYERNNDAWALVLVGADENCRP